MTSEHNAMSIYVLQSNVRVYGHDIILWFWHSQFPVFFVLLLLSLLLLYIYKTTSGTARDVLQICDDGAPQYSKRSFPTRLTVMTFPFHRLYNMYSLNLIILSAVDVVYTALMIIVGNSVVVTQLST
jgi:hypothetical protein